MESNVSGPINLGNPNEMTIYELVTNKSKIDDNLNIIHKPLPQDDQQRNPDITKAKEILNWEPKFDLDLGLDLTIKYFKNIVQK